eukprot:c21690_g1_i1 orf=190-1281(+)
MCLPLQFFLGLAQSFSIAMAGQLFKLREASHVVLALMLAWTAIAEASSLSSFWQHELPHTGMPEAFQKLASPLSPSATQVFLSQLKAGTLQASSNIEFCSSAGIYCTQKAVIVRGPQPRVCIPPFFNYEYGVLPCRHGAASASAVQASGIFISQKSLIIGRMVQLPDTSNDLKGLRFLPSSLADALPKLDTRNLPELARFYGITKDSDNELEMENTLAHCSYKSEREVRACQTSGEGLVSFVTQTVGHNAVAYTPLATMKQEVTIMDIATVTSKGDKIASCHDMRFPSLVFSCHMTQTAQLMDVSVKLANGNIVHMPVVCHMDTSYWNPSHIAFQALNVEPGKSSICHWFPENSFIFVQGPDV